MTVTEDKYRPLPDYLTIMPSKIEGLGLFTLKNIPSMTYLGLTHVLWYGEPNNLLRTPLGGFINHKDKPNCELKGRVTKHLYTLKDIEAGSELTVKYTLYSV